MGSVDILNCLLTTVSWKAGDHAWPCPIPCCWPLAPWPSLAPEQNLSAVGDDARGNPSAAVASHEVSIMDMANLDNLSKI